MTDVPVTRDEVLERLRSLAAERLDPESDHKVADSLLLRLIDDGEITAAFDEIEKWYS